MLSCLFKGLCRSLFCFIIGFFALLAISTFTAHEGGYVMMFLPMASLLVGLSWAHQRAMKARPPAMPATTVHTVRANVQQVFLSDELIINDLFQHALVANWADSQTGIHLPGREGWFLGKPAAIHLQWQVPVRRAV